LHQLLKREKIANNPTSGCFVFNFRLLVLVALLSLLTACGGGNSSSSSSPASVATPLAKDLAQICAKENPYIASATAATKAGTLSDEKKWVKAYMTERYLWYRDIPSLNADDSRYAVIANAVLDVWTSLSNYFSDSKTPLKTTSGSLVDKFSFLIDTASWNSFVDSSLKGYGFMLKTSTATGARVITVAYVFPNTPAFNAGILRGDQIVSIDGALASDTSVQGSAKFAEGLKPTIDQAHTFVVSRAGVLLSKTMQAAAISLQQAEYKVLNANGIKLGYLLFNSHVPSSETYLIQAMTAFKQQGVTELVVDLRYNGGGYLAIANALAYSVAGSVKTQGKTFELTRFSDKRSAENYAMKFSNLGLSNQIYPALNFTKIYVLVSGSTCSASESFINGLRGVNVEVELIGATTCGKPYGYYAQDNCGITYAAMEMEGVNDKGEGGYSDGMPAQCAALDDLGHPLGDVAEGMLSVAVKRMQGLSCAQASGLAMGATSLLGMGLRDESVLIRPEWQANKLLNSR
jgi:carboxyl-terminal processing protease